MAFQFLSIRREGPVEHLTLNRPEVRNAFNEHVIAELTSWARSARERASQGEIRVVVMEGAGKSFCAGADVTWMSKTVQYTEEENLRDAAAMSAMFGAIDTLPVPVVGRIHGAALGGGAGLAAVCDVVVAEEHALFGFTEVKLGILPAVISPYVIAKIGTTHARALFLTGERFDAERALRIGLVHRVAEDVDAVLAETLKQLKTSGPEAVRECKKLIAFVSTNEAAEAIPYTIEAIATRRVSEEGQQGMQAFLKKEKAPWTS